MRRRAAAIWLLAATLGMRRSPARADPAHPPDDGLESARREFDALAHEASRLAPTGRIAFANIAVNRRIDYVDDAASGDADVWRTPFETFASGQGDCEDIAIAKFFLLLAAGADPSTVRLLYAHYRDCAVPGLQVPHVVAIARDPYADPFVLDNLNLLVLPLSQRSDLEPLFSFDRVHLWEGADGARLQGVATTRLPAWRRVLARVAVQAP